MQQPTAYKTNVMPDFQSFLEVGFENYYASEEAMKAYFEALTYFCKTYAKNPETERHPLYQKSVEKSRELKLHLRNDQKIGSKVREKRPTEHPESTRYREQAFEPITYSHTQRWISFINRVFHRSVYDVSYGNVQDATIMEGEEIESYLSELPNLGVDLVQYGREYQLSVMGADPNGWNGVFSKKAVSRLAPNELPEPVPTYIPSEAVIYYRTSEFLFVLSKEKSELIGSGGMKYKEGAIFWVFDPYQTWKIKQYGRKEDYNFEFVLWDSHYYGTIPFQQNRGIANYDEDFFLTSSPFFEFDSIFAPAVPYLNKALNLSSDLDVNLVLHAFLQKIEYERPCKTCHQTGYIQMNNGDPNDTIICDSCNGTGKRKTSLFDVYQIGVDQMGGVISGDVPTVAKYVDLPLEVIDVLAKREQYYLEEAYKTLGLDFLLRPATIQAQTAESKRMDKDSALIFLEKVSNLLYGSIQFLADWINILRYGAVIPANLEENRAVFAPPVRFEIDDAMEIIGNIKLVREAGAYAAMGAQLTKNAAKELFGENSKGFRFAKAVIDLDPLFAMDDGSILALRGTGEIPEEDISLHYNINRLVSKATEEDEGFLYLPLPEQKKLIRNVAL